MNKQNGQSENNHNFAKKATLTTITAMAALILAACGNNNASSKPAGSSEPKTEQSSANNTASSSSDNSANNNTSGSENSNESKFSTLDSFESYIESKGAAINAQTPGHMVQQESGGATFSAAATLNDGTAIVITYDSSQSDSPWYILAPGKGSLTFKDLPDLNSDALNSIK
jgi:hypothetical protein